MYTFFAQKREVIQKDWRELLGPFVVSVCFLLTSSNAHAGALSEFEEQFGSIGNDQAVDVVELDSATYVVGNVSGALSGQTHSGSQDAYIRKYDTEGNVVWTRQFGTVQNDGATAVAVFNGQVYVAGYVDGTLYDLQSSGGRDIFLRGYLADGTMTMNKQWGSAGDDYVNDLIFYNDHMYLVGLTSAEFSGATTNGGQDVFVMKRHFSSELEWIKQYGTSQRDSGIGAYGDATGIYIVGQTAGVFAGETSMGNDDAFLLKIDEAGVQQWVQQDGASGYDFAFNVTAHGDNVYVVGDVEGMLAGQIGNGDYDGFLQKYAASTGALVWTRQFGTAGFDEAYDVAVDETGVYVAGFVEGSLSGQAYIGELDAYVRKYDESGSVLYTHQFGTVGSEDLFGISVANGAVSLVGSIDGVFTGETSAGGDDGYLVRLQQDTDNDSIYDSVDVSVLSYSSDFSDGTTTGSVVTRGDQFLTITDAPSSGDGIAIVADASGGATPAVISECGIATSTLTAGDSLTVTCGSVTLAITEGVVETTLIAEDGRIANTTVGAGNELTFESDEATVATPSTNKDDVVLTIDDEVTVVVPGSTDEIPTNYPVTVEVAALTPGVVTLGESASLTASVAAPINETSSIVDIEYSIDGGTFMSLAADDGAYDSALESGAINIGPFTTAGVHEVCVRGLDSITSPGEEECMLLVVYDPNGGYITGGGQIDSLAGAYRADQTLVGKAQFGFVAEYEVGAQVPTGNTQFRFNTGGLRFKSTSYDWLVVAGARAQYKGYGKIGKEDGYRFMLTAVDGDAQGNSGTADKFRMKIWDDQTGEIIYDNQHGDSDAANPATAITQGSIVIHKE